MYEIDDIKSVLRRLGVKTSNQGYQYTAYGILLALKNKDSLAYITKSLYIDIAIEFHTSWKCVERNIRTIVDSIWKTDNVELLTQICNGNRIPRPANKEFFNLMCQYFERKSLKETSKKRKQQSRTLLSDWHGLPAAGELTKRNPLPAKRNPGIEPYHLLDA